MSNQIVRSLTVISEVVAYLGLPSFDIHSLLIVYVVIYLQTLYTVFLHKSGYYRHKYIFINLVHTKRH